jgi:hypothetical protein
VVNATPRCRKADRPVGWPLHERQRGDDAGVFIADVVQKPGVERGDERALVQVVLREEGHDGARERVGPHGLRLELDLKLQVVVQHALHHLFEGRNAPGREAHASRAAQAKRPELGQGVVANEPLTVGRSLQRPVVEDNGDAIPREHDVDLHRVRSLRARAVDGRQAVFGEPKGVASVGYDQPREARGARARGQLR